MMKTITGIIAALIFSVIPLALSGQDKSKENQSVKFETSIHCNACVNNVMKNIPKEKGVKDVRCDLPTKTVVITYDGNRTNPANLRKSLEKLGYTAKQAVEKEEAKPGLK